jgi:hypothetical protein
MVQPKQDFPRRYQYWRYQRLLRLNDLLHRAKYGVGAHFGQFWIENTPYLAVSPDRLPPESAAQIARAYVSNRRDGAAPVFFVARLFLVKESFSLVSTMARLA